MKLSNERLHELFDISLRVGHRELRWKDGTWIPFGVIILVDGFHYRTNEIFHCIRNHQDAFSTKCRVTWPPTI